MRCPFAEWKPLPQNFDQPRIDPTQVVFHSLTSSNIDGAWDYFAGPDAAGTEAHFLVAYDGRIVQAMDTQIRADAQWQANDSAVSVETASNGGATDAWTAAQVEALVRLGKWLHQAHPAIPAVKCSSWETPGFGYHRMFDEWNHRQHTCPGDLRALQFYPILSRIKAPPAPAPKSTAPEDDSMLVSTQFGTALSPSFWVLHNGKIGNVAKSSVGRAVDLHITEKADWDLLVKLHGPANTQ